MSSDRGPEGRPVPAGRDAPDLAALAELDADLPDPGAAARLRAEVRRNPRAAAVLDALAATRADLATLPVPSVPPEVEARWEAALAAERAAAGPAPPARDRHVDTRGGRGRRLLLAAAVAAGLVAAGLGLLPHPDEPASPAVTRVELVALGRAAVGTMDVGDLADAARRAACLRAVAPAAEGAPLLGGRQVVLDGRPGILLVLGTGTLGRLRLVVVGPGCGALLADFVTA
jgi:hypothetical protein